MAEETYEELMRRLYPMGLEEAQKASEELANQEMMADVPVSYTHLTLPTKRIV